MVQLPDGGTIKYEKALIATGAKPFARFPGDWTLGDAVTTYRNVSVHCAIASRAKFSFFFNIPAGGLSGIVLAGEGRRQDDSDSGWWLPRLGTCLGHLSIWYAISKITLQESVYLFAS